ncbi:hypothetical protein HSBAA_52160 [Vreelandella sulfidaeris]|uniref:Uncharacterized protein n=1 Tax=Vreelandella sulfidaeris TaxID=115553 RepID=A0A455UCE8_9GAMM|nr:hypothetical protein HSBAA_52160 [Halomonas sulfidaeris]
MTTALILLAGLAMIFINIPIAVALGAVSIVAMLVLQGTNSLLGFPLVLFEGGDQVSADRHSIVRAGRRYHEYRRHLPTAD